MAEVDYERVAEEVNSELRTEYSPAHLRTVAEAWQILYTDKTKKAFPVDKLTRALIMIGGRGARPSELMDLAEE